MQPVKNTAKSGAELEEYIEKPLGNKSTRGFVVFYSIGSTGAMQKKANTPGSHNGVRFLSHK